MGAHLTEIEIGRLLESSSDSSIVVRKSSHMNECESCQMLLEQYAAKPDEWKRFVSIMEGREKQDSRAVDRTNEARSNSLDQSHPTNTENARGSRNMVAIITLIALLACGVWFRFPYLCAAWLAKQTAQNHHLQRVHHLHRQDQAVHHSRQ
ncbi:MAG: hypothetical protein R3C28_22365 [Pirellulaceae bacterium]